MYLLTHHTYFQGRCYITWRNRVTGERLVMMFDTEGRHLGRSRRYARRGDSA